MAGEWLMSCNLAHLPTVVNLCIHSHNIMTSGATLDALAHLLKTAGARRVTNFVALRTPKD